MYKLPDVCVAIDQIGMTQEKQEVRVILGSLHPLGRLLFLLHVLQLYGTFKSTDCFATEANFIVSRYKLRFNFIHETKKFH